MLDPVTKPVLRVGIAGAGAISPFHLVGWQQAERVEIVAISDPDRAKAQALANRFSVGSVHSDTAEMLARADLDVLDVIAPVGQHAPLVRLAADHGVHVVCQKPMTPTVAEAEALIAEVGDRIRFCVHENYRFRPHYAEVRDWIAAGRIGDLQHVRLAMRSASMVAPEGEVPFLLGRQPYLAHFPRLLIFEMLIHQMDALRAMVGEMDVLSAVVSRTNPALEGEDAGIIVMRQRDGGATVVLDGNISAMGYPPLPTDRLEVVGSRDTLILDRDEIWLVSDPTARTKHDLAANYQACFSGLIRSFVTGLRTGAPFPTDRLDNIETLRLMENAYEAAGWRA
ncbi:Gfo/Idh/MocA family protein [Paracoccus benzoatiresistens]|uniref:Gfo/Idh/MocA family oxidoreductase n=1 Tax=Paracoccus benzoatiresistens TaxID=2997341 RepID=A0ABT4J8V9_9RHOB|nr:Gfo/Idh/MocA family oxidoreductase [Paracoccus sp. EF6]MCZ0963354.1 Gfo/Idh/MocA family oxidoreductase [Paracoccus sp. EF6]